MAQSPNSTYRVLSTYVVQINNHSCAEVGGGAVCCCKIEAGSSAAKAGRCENLKWFLR